jgi:FeS assembly protein SufB
MAGTDLDLGRYQLGWSDEEDYVFKPKKGLNEEIVREMSAMKHEPNWMRDFRLRALRQFERKPMAQWFAVNMPDLDFDDIYYYVKPTGEQVSDWEQLPDAIKSTYEKLGIPEAERKYLSGVTAQYECLRGSTRVWTTRGMRPLKELVAGDEVFALDERTHRLEKATVVAGGPSGEKEIYEITAAGRTIGASGNHPFLTLVDDPKPGPGHARRVARWVPASELRAGDLVAIASDVPDYGAPAPMLVPEPTTVTGGRSGDRKVTLPSVSSDDVCWFFGLCLGGGYDERSTVGIDVDWADEELVEEARRGTGALFDLELALSADRRQLEAPNDPSLIRYLELNGLGGVPATRRVPPWAFGLPRAQRLSLLAGLLDAQGHAADCGTDTDPTICSANPELLADVEELVMLCGIGSSGVVPPVNRHPLGGGGAAPAYHLRLLGPCERIPVRSRRRREQMRHRGHGRVRPGTAEGRGEPPEGTAPDDRAGGMLAYLSIDRIEPAGVETVYDIEVAGRHNFVAEGFVVHNSEVVFHRNREDLAAKGILFCDMDTAVRDYPDVVRKWFGKIIPPNDNKFAALNSAVWSGGSFIYVPPGVTVDLPLQAYFRINAENMGQFERTLIIADEGSQVHYIEGCSAPVYSTDSLHSAVVELVALPGSRITYTTIQNWSNNVYNLVTKRARAEAEAHVEWIDGNIGSRLTMKYPSVYLMGPKASGEVLSVAYAGPGQHQDAGAKMIHAAPETSSTIVSKSISKDGGITTYRGLVHVDEGATGTKSFVRCDALLLDDESTSETKPYMEVGERDARIGHEATVSKVGDDQLFYLMSRGLSESEAMGMIVNGFIEPVTRTLPMEYAVEWSRLIELQMEGSVG